MVGDRNASASELEWLLTVARRWAGPHEGPDLAHDAWLAGVDASEGRGRRWWSGVVRNRRKMDLRSATRRRAREAMAGPASGSSEALDPERETARRSVASILKASLEALDPTDRTIVVLRHCEGLNASEIGAEIGLPSATVRTRLRRALQRLRTSLDEHWDEQDRPWQWAVLPAIRPGPAPIAAGGWLTLGLAAAVAGALVVGLHESRPNPTDATPTPDAPTIAGPVSSAMRGTSCGQASARRELAVSARLSSAGWPSPTRSTRPPMR